MIKNIFEKILLMLKSNRTVDDRLIKKFELYASDPNATEDLSFSIDRFGAHEGILKFIRRDEYNQELIRDIYIVFNSLPAGDLEYLGLSKGNNRNLNQFNQSFQNIQQNQNIHSNFGGATRKNLPGQLLPHQFNQKLIKILHNTSNNTFEIKFQLSLQLRNKFYKNMKILANNHISDRESKFEFIKSLKHVFDLIINEYYKKFIDLIDKEFDQFHSGTKTLVENFIKKINKYRKLFLFESLTQDQKNEAKKILLAYFNSIINNFQGEKEIIIDKVLSELDVYEDENKGLYDNLNKYLKDELLFKFDKFLLRDSTINKIINEFISVVP